MMVQAPWIQPGKYVHRARVPFLLHFLVNSSNVEWSVFFQGTRPKPCATSAKYTLRYKEVPTEPRISPAPSAVRCKSKLRSINSDFMLKIWFYLSLAPSLLSFFFDCSLSTASAFIHLQISGVNQLLGLTSGGKNAPPQSRPPVAKPIAQGATLIYFR